MSATASIVKDRGSPDGSDPVNWSVGCGQNQSAAMCARFPDVSAMRRRILRTTINDDCPHVAGPRETSTHGALEDPVSVGFGSPLRQPSRPRGSCGFASPDCSGFARSEDHYSIAVILGEHIFVRQFPTNVRHPKLQWANSRRVQVPASFRVRLPQLMCFVMTWRSRRRRGRTRTVGRRHSRVFSRPSRIVADYSDQGGMAFS